MLERVLVPLDGSKRAESALAAASALAENVLLVCSAATPPERAAAAKYLASVAGRLRRKGVGVATRLGGGEPSRLIVRTALQEEAELIVLSGRGHGGAGNGPLGSVAERVLRSSPVPVLLLRGEGRIRRVRVPAGCFGVMAAIGEMARLLGARVALAGKDPRSIDVLARLGVPVTLAAGDEEADLRVVPVGAALGRGAEKLLRDPGRSLFVVRKAI